jgi:hypothetical protein
MLLPKVPKEIKKGQNYNLDAKEYLIEEILSSKSIILIPIHKETNGNQE